MVLILEYFLGLISTFVVGYLVATALEIFFHLTLIESDKDE